jgi:tetratricopeptide (TPR) repeat protein
MKSEELANRLEKALVLRRLGNYAEALLEFETLELVSERPQEIATLMFFEVTCLTDMGKADEAQRRLLQVQKQYLTLANQIDYEYELARIQRSQGRFQEALDQVSKTRGLVADLAEVEVARELTQSLETLRGILLAELQRCEEAIPILKDVCLEDAGWAEAQMKLGDCHYSKRSYREAIDCYLRVVSKRKEVHAFFEDAATRNIGYAYYDSGDPSNAVDYLTRVVHSYDDSPGLKTELLSILALAYSQLGKIREAQKFRQLAEDVNKIQ